MVNGDYNTFCVYSIYVFHISSIYLYWCFSQYLLDCLLKVGRSWTGATDAWVGYTNDWQ